ncbi:MAG: hypothetical protein M3H12_12305, partial [Chromatiales bacterium]
MVTSDAKGQNTCQVHGRQKGAPLFKYAMGILLRDREDTELWVTAFDRVAQEALRGFSANDYMSLKSDEDRYQALSVLR